MLNTTTFRALCQQLCHPTASLSFPSRRTHGHEHREEHCRGSAAPRCCVLPTDPSWDHGGFFARGPTFGWDELHRGWLRPAGTCRQGTDLHPAAKTCALLVRTMPGLRLYCAEDSEGEPATPCPLCPATSPAAARAPCPPCQPCPQHQSHSRWKQPQHTSQRARMVKWMYADANKSPANTPLNVGVFFLHKRHN